MFTKNKIKKNPHPLRSG